MILIPRLSIFMYRNEKKMFVMQQEKINNNKLTVKGMNHKDHQTDNHLFVEVSIIISLAVYSSITKLNTEKFEMMGSSNICVFFNKTFLYLCSTGFCDTYFFLQRVGRRIQKKISIQSSKHSVIVILGMWRNSGETTEVKMEGAVSLSCFPLQENGAFRISSLLVGLLYIHQGPHTAFRISPARTRRSWCECEWI